MQVSPIVCRRAAARLAAGATVAGAAVLALSVPAFAHVTVQPEGAAAKGGYAVVDFKVPNERDDASTTKVEVNLPTDHPLASVMAQPLPGWNVRLTRTRLAEPVTVHGDKIDQAVTKVTWTADGKGIEPGYFQKFPLSVGALPDDTDQLVFKALQTYSDNKVVRWIEVPQAGQAEPQSPAPVLQLTAAADEHGTAGAHAASGDDTPDAQKENTAAASGSGGGSDTTARVLGLAGIVVGAAGVAYGVLAGRRRTV
ncbi:membrane protein [Streptomyces hygroscopicus subsp. hygroscopicus]|uniref:YcnI family copper-binding membrane protein n=1 Tax=Streptomyces sp. KHY 26 TaxID=3097359 RepID=UPI0024A26139|nr:YcnI family protein [Streptomyces hygroscopicus]GLX49780.1 membrane protein [Streptomyces hygroscopicus subsp. hygroscopicus]